MKSSKELVGSIVEEGVQEEPFQNNFQSQPGTRLLHSNLEIHLIRQVRQGNQSHNNINP